MLVFDVDLMKFVDENKLPKDIIEYCKWNICCKSIVVGKDMYVKTNTVKSVQYFKGRNYVFGGPIFQRTVLVFKNNVPIKITMDEDRFFIDRERFIPTDDNYAEIDDDYFTSEE